MDKSSRNAIDALDERLKILLPETYQDSYDDVQPVSMGSAGLKYGPDGKVAWDQIWGSFCDLAMAGGPPHKGMLLESGRRADIEAAPDQYEQVAEEICRGVTMATELHARRSPAPGWIRVACFSEAMAGWLARAIVMENIAARSEGMALDLPAAPSFRLEKEIKNVVTAAAKTCHYWMGHMPPAQRQAISHLFARMAEESPLIEPPRRGDEARPGGDDRSDDIADRIQRQTGLRRSNHRYPGWLGVECPTVHAAIWMMRAIVTGNILSRREGTVLFIPVNPATDPDGDIVVTAVATVHGLAVAKGILPRD